MNLHGASYVDISILASAWAQIIHITASSITKKLGYNVEGLESEQSKLEGKLRGKHQGYKTVYIHVYLRMLTFPLNRQQVKNLFIVYARKVYTISA